MLRAGKLLDILCKEPKIANITVSFCRQLNTRKVLTVNKLTIPHRTYLPCGSSSLQICVRNLNQNINALSREVITVQTCFTRGIHKSQHVYSQEFGGSGRGPMSQGTKTTLYYIAAVGVLALGLSYAAVPLYRIFCQAYSYGGTTQQGHDADKVESMKRIEDRVIKVRFNADTAASMTWNFKPQQSEIKVAPGETALAFYTAKNPTDRPVIGISTYNVIPFDAGLYFNKIQCFCFEEQQLNPNEEVHMPVFFYIDPEFAEDPKMENVDTLTLSYTFFEAREGVPLPVPNFARN